MKPLALPLAALVLAVALQAQTAPPSGPARPPWQPRPVIVVDPQRVLASPAPAHTRAPKHRATPRPHATPTRRPSGQGPEVFQRYETSPSPRP